MADVTITYAQEAQFRRWATDPVAFCCEAVKIESTVTEVIDGKEVTKRGRVVPLNLHDRPYQVDCIEKFLQNDLCTVLKARQIGLTTIACALALWLLLFHENRFILVLSKSDGDAKKFLRRIRRMYERLDPWVKARAPQPKKKFGVQEAEFTNGSSIYSYTSASDHGRGDTPTEVFLDEVGKMKNADDSWSDLRPATEDGGKLWIFGTADGYRDWFHLKWMEWEKDPEICDIFYGWEAVPGRDGAWAAKMRRELGEAKFLREYPATPEEAFQSSGSNVFSVEVLTEIVPDEPRRYRIERGPTGMLDLMEEATHTDEFGLFIYEKPIDGARYLTAADPSEGLVGGDPSVIQVLRWSRHEIVQAAVYRGRLEPDEFAEMDHWVSLLYNRASVAVERNNHGSTVLSRMRQLRTPNVIRGGANRPGLWTGPGSKATNIAVTRKALSDKHLILRDRRTIEELMGFQERMTAAGNPQYEGTEHDDHVDALCIGVGYAVANAPYERVAEPPPVEEPPPAFSLDWFESRRVPARSRII